eukprot:2945970-Prymnesium_polylepis.1
MGWWEMGWWAIALGGGRAERWGGARAGWMTLQVGWAARIGLIVLRLVWSSLTARGAPDERGRRRRRRA